LKKFKTIVSVSTIKKVFNYGWWVFGVLALAFLVLGFLDLLSSEVALSLFMCFGVLFALTLGISGMAGVYKKEVSEEELYSLFSQWMIAFIVVVIVTVVAILL